MTDQTIAYYNHNAEAFSAGTLASDMEQARSRFLACLPPLQATPADACILDSGDFDLAERISGKNVSAVLLLAKKDSLEDLLPACIVAGFLCGERETPEIWLPQLLALCCRLRETRLREHDLRRKLDDTRLVNRAKLLLMTRLGMTEAEAHRYVEKTAMDIGAARRDVAIAIIRTYEE